jgi:hypothetical protein
MKVGGMEALDLIGVLIFAAVMNLFHLPTILTFAIPASALATLYFGKRNKPDGFLIHLLRYYLTPGVYSAGAPTENGEILYRKIYEK